MRKSQDEKAKYERGNVLKKKVLKTKKSFKIKLRRSFWKCVDALAGSLHAYDAKVLYG